MLVNLLSSFRFLFWKLHHRGIPEKAAADKASARLGEGGVVGNGYLVGCHRTDWHRYVHSRKGRESLKVGSHADTHTHAIKTQRERHIERERKTHTLERTQAQAGSTQHSPTFGFSLLLQFGKDVMRTEGGKQGKGEGGGQGSEGQTPRHGHDSGRCGGGRERE